MRDLIIEVNGQCPTFRQVNRSAEKTVAASYPDALFWLQVYPHLADRRAPVPHARIVCPWSIAAELDDTATPAPRRQNILEALKSGLKTIRQYDLPACRIMFAEEHSTGKITVWVE